MSRNIKVPAIILRARPVGENHRGLSMLVGGEGLLHPFAYGAQGKRSLLRSSAVPYNRGEAELHYDGAKDRWRLMSFDAVETFDGVREDLDRFYTASAWAEILLGTHGAGEDSERLYELASEAFGVLNSTMPGGLGRLRTAFLWSFLDLEGVGPEPGFCGRCGRRLPVGEGGEPARFLSDGLLVGAECAGFEAPVLPDGARKWLDVIRGRSLGDALRIGLSADAAAAAERWLMTIMQSLLGRPLKSGVFISPFR